MVPQQQRYEDVLFEDHSITNAIRDHFDDTSMPFGALFLVIYNS